MRSRLELTMLRPRGRSTTVLITAKMADAAWRLRRHAAMPSRSLALQASRDVTRIWPALSAAVLSI